LKIISLSGQQEVGSNKADAFKGGARTVDSDLDVRFSGNLPQLGYHYEAPYWPDSWFYNGMGLYW
jgi:hypothetical protein